MSNKNLHLQYKLDYPDGSERPTGNVILIVIDLNNNNNVEDVLTTPCTLEGLRASMQHLYSEHGDIFVSANDTALFDYEFVHAELDAKLTEELAQAAAEDAKYEKERNMKTAKKVLDMLSTQSFDDFYRGPHMDFIEGEPNALSEEEILEMIVNKFIKKF
jgi:hypothetical protein